LRCTAVSCFPPGLSQVKASCVISSAGRDRKTVNSLIGNKILRDLLTVFPSNYNSTCRPCRVRVCARECASARVRAMALKVIITGRTPHTLSGPHVCCERALKSAGKRNTHGGVGAGAFGKPPARGTLRENVRAFSGPLWRRGGSPPAG
jgi:hypothetical protein